MIRDTSAERYSLRQEVPVSDPTTEELEEILGPRKEPIPLTDEEKDRLVWQFKGLLGSGVWSSALRDPDSLTFEQLVINLHMYDRLFIAWALVAKMRGYSHSPDWLADSCTEEELERALEVKREREGVSTTR